ncbi:carbonic anhydrase [Thelephora terrestris]|uniref:Carbonic anhydrase n=1 Tax=Thelephora terrestris TaxID=56493 RepID=A0A9P6L6C1_9AGAM|nr:carbonic anhydrase [Thelephora terrestris]
MASNDLVIQKMLEHNAKWAHSIVQADPGFFIRSAAVQTPQVLWIGCSDSRVPESVITRFMPGDIFVHRNIANQVHPKDDNVLSVVEYAVGALKVKHVIVVGHTECGGAKHCLAAAEEPPQVPTDPLHRWLEPLTELARSLPQEERTLPILVKKNVEKQVKTLKSMETIQKAKVHVHGWIYDLSTGHLNDRAVDLVD